MLNFDLFSSIPPIGHLYFFYGLVFFLLGITILLKDIKSSDLRFARSFYFLAGFGFTHGTHEWLELYVILKRHHLPESEIFPVKLLAVFFERRCQVYDFQFTSEDRRPDTIHKDNVSLLFKNDWNSLVHMEYVLRVLGE